MHTLSIPAPRSTQAADELGGARAIEVATMLGDSVVHVKHCMDPRGGAIRRATWALLAASVACLIAAAVGFLLSVDHAATNQHALEVHTRVLKKPAYAFRPSPPVPGLDLLTFGGLGLGLAGMAAALVRVRRERSSPYFRVGTAPGVEQPLATAPTPSFPLIAPAGDDFVFSYGPGIDGELVVDGRATSLAELAAAGRARPSAVAAGAFELPIPPAARIRARSGLTTFVVTAVARPRAHAAPLLASVERRTLAYVAGSLALHLGVWAFLQTIPVEESSAHIELSSQEAAGLRGNTTATEAAPPLEAELDDGDTGGGSEGMGAKMALAEGTAGRPDSQRADGHIRIKDNQRATALSREQAIEAARTAGFLGSASSLRGGIYALAGTADLSSGFDQADVYGALFGADGDSRGSFGGGRSEWGAGGGCTMPPCGVIGTGRYGTIGTGDKAGDGWGGPGSGRGGLHQHAAVVPTSSLGQPRLVGGLDKAIIKRYIKRSLDKIAYCYERELLAKPGLAGTIGVQFYIAPNGTVQTSTGSGFDGEVARCVADVVKAIKFPMPTDGGGVQVNYPFNFHAAG